ncbi:Uncharacterized protein TCM_044659 [Theobroma cacao]|uniref:Uncharacterized protein n=1 Tax=Theobroma cacao TaxID=3641 RepID=A0A061FQD2_THECC|nr:Uncharacterized protein TCM_044659 [Theobroma cacao]
MSAFNSRSYSEVVVGPGKTIAKNHGKERGNDKSQPEVRMQDTKKRREVISQSKKETGGKRKTKQHNGAKMVTIKTNIPEEEMLWIKCSAIGKLKVKADCERIQKGLSREGIHAQERILDDQSVLVTFEELGIVEAMLDHYLEQFDGWFEYLALVSYRRMLGEFIATDKSTFKRERFVEAFILVKVRSRSMIPDYVTIKVEGKFHIICISIVGSESQCKLEAYWKRKKKLLEETSGGYGVDSRVVASLVHGDGTFPVNRKRGTVMSDCVKEFKLEGDLTSEGREGPKERVFGQKRVDGKSDRLRVIDTREDMGEKSEKGTTESVKQVKELVVLSRYKKVGRETGTLDSRMEKKKKTARRKENSKIDMEDQSLSGEWAKEIQIGPLEGKKEIDKLSSNAKMGSSSQIPRKKELEPGKVSVVALMDQVKQGPKDQVKQGTEGLNLVNDEKENQKSEMNKEGRAKHDDIWGNEEYRLRMGRKRLTKV